MAETVPAALLPTRTEPVRRRLAGLSAATQRRPGISARRSPGAGPGSVPARYRRRCQPAVPTGATLAAGQRYSCPRRPAMELNWHWPWVFILLPLPWLVRAVLPPLPPQQAALRVAALQRWQLAASDNSGVTGAVSGAIPWLALGVWLALLTALPRPYQLGDVVEMPVTGRDLMLAVDLSGSMEIEDMQWENRPVNRLVVVKQVIGDFVERRQGDRLGLILFGSEAYLQTPLTFDRATVKELLLEAQIGLAGQKTAIGDAIGLGIKRLQEQPQDSRVIVLISDGANNAGALEPQKAATLAAQHHIRIYTICLVAEAMEVPGFLGSRTVNPSRHMDEEALRDIARLTGGSYFRARNSNELQSIYALLDELEPTDRDAQIFRPQQNLYHWPLLLAFLLSLLLA